MSDLEMGKGKSAAEKVAETAKDVDVSRYIGKRPKKQDSCLCIPIFIIACLVAIVLPPLSVWLQKRHLRKLADNEAERQSKKLAQRYEFDYDRCKSNFKISFVLTLLGWIPGSIHALVCLREFPWYIGD